MLKPSFFTNEQLGSLSFGARLVFQGLWLVADREGKLEDRPSRLKVEIMPYDKVNMNALLQALHDAGFIVRYEANGVPYIQIPNFGKHQRIHPNEAPSDIPNPEPSGNVPSATHQGPSKSSRITSYSVPTLTPNSPSDDPSDHPQEEPTPPATALPVDRFYATSKRNEEIAALIDHATANGRKLDGGRTAAFLKAHPKTAVMDALQQAIGRKAAGLEDYMEGVLRNGATQRRRSGPKRVTDAADLARARTEF